MDFSEWEPLVVAVIVALVSLPYWLGPLLIRVTMRQSAEPELHLFDAVDSLLPGDVSAFFHRVRMALEPLGFAVMAGLALPNQIARVQALVLLLVHRAHRDAALATAIYAKTPQGTKLQTAYLELVSRFRDGAVVQTNNTDQLSAFPPRPNFTTARLPMIQNLDRLYQLHQQLTNRVGDKSGKVLRVEEEFRGDAVAYLARALIEELEAQIETGYMYLSSAEGLFRPTWKGAFLMTWGLLWPFSALRRYRRDRQAQQLLTELDA